MQVYCSNCNTPHTISHEELKGLRNLVINCSGCDKKIKIQFCPGCGAFYSITFSNIQPGSYRYQCRKCGIEFQITIPGLSGTGAVKTMSSAAPAKQAGPSLRTPGPSESRAPLRENDITFMQNSINTFTVNELFSITATAFSIKKIVPAAVAALVMLLLVRLITMLQGIFPAALHQGRDAAYLLLNLVPAAVLLSLYMAAAVVVSKVTLERIFHNRDAGWNALALFALKKCPAIIFCNVTALILVSAALFVFGKIPLLGPLMFSVAFFPVYVFSILTALLIFAGVWFYPPITAHRESGMIMNLKNLILFIKKHNLTLLYTIPVASMLALVTFAVVFIIHTFALSLTITLSKAVLSGDVSAAFSGIPVIFVKISESALGGINGSVFRELGSGLTMVHTFSGIILGASMTLITVLLISIFFSVTATISTHIYIMLERGLTVDDKRKALTMFILFMFLAVIVMARKVI